MARTKLSPEERAAKKAANGFGVDTAEKLQTLLNARIKKGGNNSADVMMMWFRLLMIAPAIWEPRYNAWLAAQAKTRLVIKEGEKPEVDSLPF